jgi:radical SAM protein with 4Fe4S-binding SPASM domain
VSKIAVILSMLHEALESNSASRLFRAQPVLRWTLRRLAGAERLSAAGVLCWEDQLPHVADIAGEGGAHVLAKGPRVAIPEMDAITIARRWSDGWRSGLLSTCAFDLGFYAPWALELAERLEVDGVVLIDPSAALVDPLLVDALIAHADGDTDHEFFFQPAAPGLSGPMVRMPLLKRLKDARTHVGRVLHYRPDQLSRELLGGPTNAPVPTAVSRSPHRFALSSDRQIARITDAMVSLNGQLVSSPAEELVARMHATHATEPMPREVVLELNTTRLSRPIFSPLSRGPIDRPPLALSQAQSLFRELAELDDTRLTLAGVGDPLLHEQIFEIIESARSIGKVAVHVESDFLIENPQAIENLATSGVDVVSVILPALTPTTYETMMGIDDYARVLENVRLFATARAARGANVPILVPTFVKCRQNLGEMEAWYDQWLTAVGAAVIRGPSDFGGLADDTAVADMSPPRRTACSRLASRVTVLSDGRIVSCEQDILGRQSFGTLGVDSLKETWQHRMSKLRQTHRDGQWAANPVCANCKEWHRP